MRFLPFESGVKMIFTCNLIPYTMKKKNVGDATKAASYMDEKLAVVMKNGWQC